MGMLLMGISEDTTINLSSSLVPADKNARLEKSIEYFKKAIDILSETDLPNSLIDLYSQISRAYEKNQDFMNSLYYHKKYASLRDSIFNVEKMKVISSIEFRGQLELKDKKLEIANLMMERQKLTLDRQNLIAYFLVGSIIVLALIIIVIINERKKSEKLLLNILPYEIANRLKRKPESIADRYENATVIFIDIVDFTEISEEIEPEQTVAMLNEIFTTFDEIARQYDLEKIKTIGDCYMAAAGIPKQIPQHADAAAGMALEVRNKMKNYVAPGGIPVRFRIGIDSGPVVAGVIGESKFIYDLWGDAVNTASRMETYGVIDEIQVTQNFISSLINGYLLMERGRVEIKGKGLMKTYLLLDYSEKKTILQLNTKSLESPNP
jgi:class 3 adenylate cyclase